MRLKVISLLVICILLSAVVQVAAQEIGSAPVVFGVLFYSPNCPHCHDVIQNYVPQSEAEFSDSLVLLFVDISQQGGNFLFHATCNTLDEEACSGVPLMVIGEEVMVGSRQIPARVPGLIREGLDAGGIELPPVPELREAYRAFVQSQERAVEGENTPEATPETGATPDAQEVIGFGEEESGEKPEDREPENLAGTGGLGEAPSLNSESWIDRLNNDPEGNAIAIVTLLGLLVSLGAELPYGLKGMLVEGSTLSTGAITITLIASILMAITLAAESSGDTLAVIGSWGMLVLLLVSAIVLAVSRVTTRIVPLIALAGLLTAIYLVQVEVSATEATCGLIGDCNAVQQSEYAALFGALPVRGLGVIGYIAILAVWAIPRVRRTTSIYTSLTQLALFGLAVFGVAFSAYLTFLEPFVIGATCIWCITSALLMILLLWLVSPAAWQTLLEFRQIREMPKHASYGD